MVRGPVKNRTHAKSATAEKNSVPRQADKPDIPGSSQRALYNGTFSFSGPDKLWTNKAQVASLGRVHGGLISLRLTNPGGT